MPHLSRHLAQGVTGAKLKRMKFRSLIIVAMLLAGCASQQPPVTQPSPVIQPPVIQQPPASQQPSGSSDTKNQGDNDRFRDFYECERESAFAGAGDKRQSFDSCMKARGY